MMSSNFEKKKWLKINNCVLFSNSIKIKTLKKWFNDEKSSETSSKLALLIETQSKQIFRLILVSKQRGNNKLKATQCVEHTLFVT